MSPPKFICGECGYCFDEPLHAEVAVFGYVRTLSLCPRCQEVWCTYDLNKDGKVNDE